MSAIDDHVAIVYDTRVSRLKGPGRVLWFFQSLCDHRLRHAHLASLGLCCYSQAARRAVAHRPTCGAASINLVHARESSVGRASRTSARKQCNERQTALFFTGSPPRGGASADGRCCDRHVHAREFRGRRRHVGGSECGASRRVGSAIARCAFFIGYSRPPRSTL